MDSYKHKTLVRIVRLCSMALSTFLLFSCINDNLEDCFNTQITYRYAREGSPKNVIQSYVHSLNEYIFNSEGILYKVNELPSKRTVSSHELPPGEYTLISWANHDNVSQINNLAIGETSKEEILMYINKKTTPNSERLFYTYRTFKVNERGISYVHADMVQAYCSLNMSIRWRSTPPDNTKNLRLVYKQVPHTYSFLPSFVSERNSWYPHDAGLDSYPTKSSAEIHYTPTILPEDDIITYHQDVKINVDKKINSTFITYRYRNDSPLLLSLYWGDEQIMQEIGLDRFFREMKIDLDKSLYQEYNLEIEIDGKKVNVAFVSLTDWGEGGIVN